MWLFIGVVAIMVVLVVYGLFVDIRMWRVRRSLSADEKAENRARLPDEVMHRRRHALRWYRTRMGRYGLLAAIVDIVQGMGGGRG